MMLYSCTHMATVGVKGLTRAEAGNVFHYGVAIFDFYGCLLHLVNEWQRRRHVVLERGCFKQESSVVADKPARRESVQKLLQFDVLTTMSLAILVRLHSLSSLAVVQLLRPKSAKSREIL